MLKELPEQCLPDPERCLPETECLKKVEGTLMLAFGIIGLSLPAAFFSGWLPIGEMTSATPGQFPEVLALGAMACASLWWGYVLWRSKGYDQVWEEQGVLWLWGWGVTVQLLLGLVFLVAGIEVLLSSLP